MWGRGNLKSVMTFTTITHTDCVHMTSDTERTDRRLREWAGYRLSTNDSSRSSSSSLTPTYTQAHTRRRTDLPAVSQAWLVSRCWLLITRRLWPVLFASMARRSQGYWTALTVCLLCCNVFCPHMTCDLSREYVVFRCIWRAPPPSTHLAPCQIYACKLVWHLFVRFA